MEFEISGHPEPRTIAEYYEQELEPAMAREIETHLVACRLCRAILMQLREYLDDGTPADGHER